jgi:hypothetical protein
MSGVVRRGTVVLAVAVVSVAALLAPPAARVVDARIGPTPVLAYYYIWFEPSSWDRAKIDYPLLGRYSSDDAAIMEQHILEAKAAGIDGFIVSWKSTARLDSRLETLATLAEKHDFKLVVIYESLDFGRQPLPVDQIRDDIATFADRWGDRPAFDLFDKAALIISGSWEFTPQELQTMIGDARDRILVLASERNVQAYGLISSLVDGNAYYWSSANPESAGFAKKLKAMGEAVHDTDGLWIAPASPGFDARLVGGTRVIDRADGDTLRAEVAAAAQSSPDALGIISWNEFSENSHIEPSEQFGRTALDTLAELTGKSTDGVSLGPMDFDSERQDDAAGTISDVEKALAITGLVGLLVIAWVVLIRRRRRHGSVPAAGSARDGGPSGPGIDPEGPRAV